MPWPKGKPRKWAVPEYLVNERPPDNGDLIAPKVGRREAQQMAQSELIQFVESGDHLVAESYFPGEKARAEEAYRAAVGHESRRRKAVASANRARGDLTRAWIENRCADLLANSEATRKWMVCSIIERMESGLHAYDLPAESTIYRHLSVILNSRK